MRQLCSALGTFEIDHVIPVSQSFSGQQLELQALCLECDRTKTSLEGNHSTTRTPRLPPLVFQLQKWDVDRPCQGIDVCRCGKNGLAKRSLPAARLSAPWTSSRRRRASWRTSCGWICPATTAGSWQGLVRQARLRLLAGSGTGAVADFKWSLDAWSSCCSGWSRAGWRARSTSQAAINSLVCLEFGIGLLHEDLQPLRSMEAEPIRAKTLWATAWTARVCC